MSNPDLHLAQLKANAAELRDAIDVTRTALLVELEPKNLMHSATQTITKQLTEQIDPRISRVLSSHGTTILALTAAAVAYGIGQRTFAKRRDASPTNGKPIKSSQDRTSSLLELAKEVTTLVAMVSQALAPGSVHDDNRANKD